MQHSCCRTQCFFFCLQSPYRAGIGAFRLGRDDRWAVSGGHHCTTWPGLALPTASVPSRLIISASLVGPDTPSSFLHFADVLRRRRNLGIEYIGAWLPRLHLLRQLETRRTVYNCRRSLRNNPPVTRGCSWTVRISWPRKYRVQQFSHLLQNRFTFFRQPYQYPRRCIWSCVHWLP